MLEYQRYSVVPVERSVLSYAANSHVLQREKDVGPVASDSATSHLV